MPHATRIIGQPEIAFEVTDVLILGGGLAGLRAAVAAREQGSAVTVVHLARGSSPFIIGANVPLGGSGSGDSPSVYFEDTVRGGYGLNDRRLVRRLVSGAVPAFHELQALGIPFAADSGRILLRHLSGNTWPRSVYVPDGIGRVIRERLLAKARELGIRTLHGWRVVSLLRDDGAAVGALAVQPRSGELMAVGARATVLAMGGIGRLYGDSTYPVDIAADAYALAYDAGATLLDMEFVQFEPVVTAWPLACKGLEMPTAMLGDGAQLLNRNAERFMLRYNPPYAETRIEKARLALCIQREIDEGRGYEDRTVLFDTRTVPRAKLESYVSHCKRLRAAGIEPAREAPRVRPAAHSEMGGVAIDENGFSGVPGLYAAGEAAGGLHGASRLAGNGGSDTIVFGAIAGAAAAQNLLPRAERDWQTIVRRTMPEFAAGAIREAEQLAIKDAIREVMGSAAGLYRDATGLSRGLERLDSLEAEGGGGVATSDLAAAVPAISTRNMALVARLILTAARERTESRGAHQRRDFPEQDDARWMHHIAWRKGRNGAPEMSAGEIH